jgi:hypothetical protein
MGTMSRGVQAALVVVVVLVGAAAAPIYHNITRGAATSTGPVTSPSPTLAASPNLTTSPSAAPAPSPSPSPEASPSATAEASPTAPPSPAASASATATPTGAAPYPAQINAGFTAAYSGSGTLAALASDSRDSGTSVCAGINETSQTFAAGYDGNYFISITFPDGVTLSTGYIKTPTGRQDFAEYQAGGKQYGAATVATTPGSHTYCLKRGDSGWVMTDDGTAIACAGCPNETAANTAKATIKFQSTVANIDSSKPKQSFNLVVPGFHDIAVGDKPPTQLRGQVITY